MYSIYINVPKVSDRFFVKVSVIAVCTKDDDCKKNRPKISEIFCSGSTLPCGMIYLSFHGHYSCILSPFSMCQLSKWSRGSAV